MKANVCKTARQLAKTRWFVLGHSSALAAHWQTRRETFPASSNMHEQVWHSYEEAARTLHQRHWVSSFTDFLSRSMRALVGHKWLLQNFLFYRSGQAHAGESWFNDNEATRLSEAENLDGFGHSDVKCLWVRFTCQVLDSVWSLLNFPATVSKCE